MKTLYIYIPLIFIFYSCQNQVSGQKELSRNLTLKDLFNEAPCDKVEFFYCDSCETTNEFFSFEKTNGMLKSDTLMYFKKTYLDSTKINWEKYEYNNYFSPVYFYYRKNQEDYKVTNEVKHSIQVISYELDTSLSKYQNMSLIEMQYIVKQKMLSMINCMRNSKEYVDQSSLLIFEGFAYRNEAREQTYSIEELGYDECTINKLHYCEYAFYNDSYSHNFTFQYDDIPTRNSDGEFGSVLKFSIKVIDFL